MKKLISLLLALVMVFALATVALAVTDPNNDPNAGKGEDDTFVDESVVYVTKNFFLTNIGMTSPAASFTLEQVGAGRVTEGDATSAPDLGTITPVTYAAGEATVEGVKKDIAIQLPTYERVGIYEYDLREVRTDNNLAGVKYYEGPIKLKVTVIEQNGRVRVAAVHTEGNGEGKSDVFPNEYSAGDLSISKTVTGNMGDKTKYFKVNVLLTGQNGKIYQEPLTVTGGTRIEDGVTDCNESTIMIAKAKDFYIKHGETITIKNLPYGVKYTVTEADYVTSEGYEQPVYTFGDETTDEVDSATETVGITNKKTSDVDTGVVLDSMPYVLLLAVAVIGMIMMVRKKRSYEN